ncbi:MAG: SEC-C metal-binding domain-containing protein [Actinomycetota bacterium]|nr:SEC-C metal-binding domain-containing protein [Actinomycetota bacterium]
MWCSGCCHGNCKGDATHSARALLEWTPSRTSSGFAVVLGIAFLDWQGPCLSYCEQREIGRNDPCPCGSGLELKKCLSAFARTRHMQSAGIAMRWSLRS